MTSLPPFIMTSEKGTFARRTIEERKPLIIDRILADFDYTPLIRKDLRKLQDELKNGQIVPLHEDTSDRSIWDKAVKPWLGKTWLEIPWFLAETFFYRRVLEIIQYFQPGPWANIDPYRHLKERESTESLPEFIAFFSSRGKEKNLADFKNACYRALWGNRGDLSNLDIYESAMGEQTDKIILDQTVEAYQLLTQKPAKIAYFFDNVGKELFFDLHLIDYLLEAGLASTITCYLKNQPFFVSDAMPNDFLMSMDLLISSPVKEIQNFGKRLKFAQLSQKVTIETPPFLTTSSMYRDMPEVSFNQLKDHDLVVMKGDVNYRRLFGDRHWPATTPINAAAKYFPTNFLSLRTLKADLILGLTEKRLDEILKSAEPDWLTNGRRGMITFFQK
ncbi:MAG: damage-control phosphatase ARMT1 family protein [Anaerolineales bacterium]